MNWLTQPYTWDWAVITVCALATVAYLFLEYRKDLARLWRFFTVEMPSQEQAQGPLWPDGAAEKLPRPWHHPAPKGFANSSRTSSRDHLDSVVRMTERPR